MSDQHYAKFLSYLALLLEENKLPKEALDHQLQGDFKEFREFHISGDLLIIYVIEDGYLKLVRIGSHAQLFE